MEVVEPPAGQGREGGEQFPERPGIQAGVEGGARLERRAERTEGIDRKAHVGKAVRAADGGAVRRERLDVDCDVIEQALPPETFDERGPPAVGVELDAVAERADAAEEFLSLIHI